MTLSHVEGGEPSAAAPVSGFQHLDPGVALHVFTFLRARQVAAATLVCKAFQEITQSQALWKQLYEKEFAENVQNLLNDRICDVPDALVDWRELVRHGLSLRDLRTAHWQQITPLDDPLTPNRSVRPVAREGHAACSWGSDSNSFLLFGGWGCGIRNDLYLLEKKQGGYVWRGVPVAGDRPAIRYGHSVTRCGKNWDMMVVYGGMQSGGYMGEIEELAVLRPRIKKPQDASGSAQPTEPPQPPQSQQQEYEWHEPQLKGHKPKPRGYHAACASPDGSKVYLFGGIAEHDCCNTLAVVNVETWECEVLATTGTPPLERFGCSMAVWGNGLWVVGGGHGNDLARSGYDLEDVHRLDLITLSWSEPEIRNINRYKERLGRAHGYTMVGSKLVMFGGSLELGKDITWLDLEHRVFGEPTITGTAPAARMSAVICLCGTDVLLMGGWIPARGEVRDVNVKTRGGLRVADLFKDKMGDVFKLKMVLNDQELSSMRQLNCARATNKTSGMMGGSGGVGPTRAAWLRMTSSPRAADVRTNQWGGPSGCNIAAGPAGGCSSSAPAADDDGDDDVDEGGEGGPSASKGVRVKGGEVASWSVFKDEDDQPWSTGVLPGGLLDIPEPDTATDRGGGCRGGNRTSALANALIAQITKYFGLLRHVRLLKEVGQDVPVHVSRRLQDTLNMVKVMRERAQEQHALELPDWLEHMLDATSDDDEGDTTSSSSSSEEEEEEEEEDGTDEEDDEGGEEKGEGGSTSTSSGEEEMGGS